MQQTDVTRPLASRDGGLRREDYNFEHFRTKHLRSDLQATLEKRGIPPGGMAPDFELSRVNGAALRLSELRGTPTLLHFGSFT
jgi:cytochrome oxidase Cu insertion factor (SCO1/SenC/PrrC family)